MNVALTRKQIRRVDQLAIERYRIAGVVLMENAGRNAAAIIRDTYGSTTGEAFICCGPGNNGGDGCVIARHLHNAGWSVRLMLAGDPSRMTHDAEANYAIVEAMGLERIVAPDWDTERATIESIRDDEVVVDALFGTGFSGEVRSPTAELIDAINAASKRAVVAIDVPSGLDCDTGVPSNATIRADLTITFVAAKTGLVAETAAPYVGRLEVADIGTPRELLAEIVAKSA
ncbi:MAG: NAD(P)H-hydrate epimerase [Phycisphaerae bacterium]